MESLISNQKLDELRKLLLTRLTFGTAGIRGFMRTGYAAMNDLVIIQTSQGLVEYLSRTYSDLTQRGVIIGHDARHNSRRFAIRTAAAFLQKNIPVYLFSDIVPTPYVPFAIKLLKCSAGVMVTASHNPKGDNGYKVYFANGAQITSPHDKGIQACIEDNLKPWAMAWQDEQIREQVKDPLKQVNEAYMASIKARILDAPLVTSTSLKFTYTALHGVGHAYLTQALGLCGFPSFHPVPEQQEPDPEFPTVIFPNPEEGKGVLDLSIKTADATGSQIILANDPDADRCAVAEKQDDGSWRILTGNEIGALLGWWTWYLHCQRHQQHEQHAGLKPSDCYMLASAVSSKILQTIARKEQFNFVETLTGFKWMGNKAHQLIGDGKTVVFAFEEAIGYMCGPQVLDKDGISAAIEVAQLAAFLKAKSSSLCQQLNDIHNQYGYHFSINSYFLCYDKDVIAKIFARLSDFEGSGTYPKAIGPYRVARVRDLNAGYDSDTVGNVPVSGHG